MNALFVSVAFILLFFFNDANCLNYSKINKNILGKRNINNQNDNNENNLKNNHKNKEKQLNKNTDGTINYTADDNTHVYEDENIDKELAKHKPPSHQLKLNEEIYKPDGFEIYYEKIAKDTIGIYFDYTANDSVYDEYIFRIRYFGNEEYTTEPNVLNYTIGGNQIILKRFDDAYYVVCVTLYSSNPNFNILPLSTSDMCIDLIVGTGFNYILIKLYYNFKIDS